MRGFPCGHDDAECGADAEADGEELQPVWYVQSREARVAQAINEGRKSQHQYEESHAHNGFSHRLIVLAFFRKHSVADRVREEQAGWAGCINDTKVDFALHRYALAPVFGGFAFYEGCVTALSVVHFILACILSGR